MFTSVFLEKTRRIPKALFAVFGKYGMMKLQEHLREGRALKRVLGIKRLKSTYNKIMIHHRKQCAYSARHIAFCYFNFAAKFFSLDSFPRG